VKENDLSEPWDAGLEGERSKLSERRPQKRARRSSFRGNGFSGVNDDPLGQPDGREKFGQEEEGYQTL